MLDAARLAREGMAEDVRANVPHSTHGFSRLSPPFFVANGPALHQGAAWQTVGCPSSPTGSLDGTSACSSTSSFSEEDEDRCWICLDSDSAEPLISACGCKWKVHQCCIVRWQMHNAGKAEELTCRFCKQTLQDWKEAIKVPEDTVDKLKPLIFAIKFNDKFYKLEVTNTHEGIERFKRQVRKITKSDDFEITFKINMPDSRLPEVRMEGMSSFETALVCAQYARHAKKE